MQVSLITTTSPGGNEYALSEFLNFDIFRVNNMIKLKFQIFIKLNVKC